MTIESLLVSLPAGLVASSVDRDAPGFSVKYFDLCE